MSTPVEERNHAMIIVQYLLDARKPVSIPAVGEPKNEFADPIEPVRLALQREDHLARGAIGNRGEPPDAPQAAGGTL